MNKKDILKSFTLGFIPLLIFILADEIFEMVYALLIAIGTGIIQFLWTYFRKKIVDKFIVLDTILIIFLGCISIISDSDVFVKIKPAIIEIVFVIMIGLTVFSKHPILILMAQRYMKGIELGETHITMMRKMMFSLLIIFIIHIILVFYSAFYMDNASYAFISGGLFYILIGAVFLFEFIRGKLFQRKLIKQHKSEDQFEIINNEGKVIGVAPRSVCHSSPDYLHKVIHVFIVNNKNELLTQLRSDKKDTRQNTWDVSLSIHPLAGESIENAILRKAKQELNITINNCRFLFSGILKNQSESMLVLSYVTYNDDNISINPEEITDYMFSRKKDIQHKLNENFYNIEFSEELKRFLKMNII